MTRRTAAQAEKEIRDSARLLRAWKKFHREEREAVLAGPYAVTLAELFRMFANIECVRPAQLVGFIGAINWSAIPYDARLVVLHELNSAITAFRTKRGLEPIDDGLPDQPDTPSRAIKAIIFPHVADVAPTEAQLGSDIKRLVKQGTTS